MIQVVDGRALNVDGSLQRDLRAFLAEAAPTAGACFEHDPRWLRVLEEGLGHQTFVLLARQSPPSRIQGYLPLALVKSRLFGRFLVSLPYLNRAGVVAQDDATRAELLEAAVALAGRCRVQYLELRHGAFALAHPRITHHRDDKALMLLDLPGDSDVLWKGLDAKVRNQVRKGEKAGLAVRWGGVDRLDDFYDVFSVNMRDLGTPVYPRRLFERIVTHFADQAELAVVMHDGRPVAGALLLHQPDGGGTQVPSASCLRAFNHTSANMWMYHQLLCRAIQRGSGVFDFGRSSPDSGTYRFKKQWGASPHPTTWQYHVFHGEVGALRPEHPRMQRRIATWQKLPVWVTRMVGPSIVRGIP